MPFDRSKYPSNWEEISQRVRFERAGGQCEWVEDGIRCEARHGELHPVTKSKVVLTTAHLDNPDPQDCRDENLAALCQLHHLALDRPHHLAKAKQTRLTRADAQRPLLSELIEEK